MAWWTAPLFAGAFMLGLLRPWLERALRRPAPLPTRTQVAVALALFVIAYFASVLPLPWEIVSLLLVLIFLAGYRACDRTFVGLGIALSAAIGGPLVEALLVACGTFVHVHPVLLGVSGWLPFLYLCAAVALSTLGKRLVDA